MTTEKDPIDPALLQKLEDRMMCKVEKVGKEPLNDLQSIVEKKKLEWKDVAFMGKTTVFLFVNSLIGRNWKHVEATALKSGVFNIYVKVFCCFNQI